MEEVLVDIVLRPAKYGLHIQTITLGKTGDFRSPLSTKNGIYFYKKGMTHYDKDADKLFLGYDTHNCVVQCSMGEASQLSNVLLNRLKEVFTKVETRTTKHCATGFRAYVDRQAGSMVESQILQEYKKKE